MIFFNLFQVQWTDLVDIGILSLLIYYLILLVQGTKSFQILLGLLALLSLYYLSVFLELHSMLWVFQNILQYTVILIVIIFQADIRNALANFGKTEVFKKKAEHTKYLRRIMKAVRFLHSNKIGLIIAFEKQISLGEYIKTGVKLQAIITSSLILSIFSKNSPLHDGAVIIDHKYCLVAASCIFPLSARIDLEPSYGTRHRAALGLSELTDAIILIISEETGKISLFSEGKIEKNISIKKIAFILNKYLQNDKTKKK